MKRILTLSVLMFFGTIYSFGQSGILGGDFEHWYQKPGHNYFEPANSYFWTLNQLDTVVALRPMVTVTPCDTAHSGTYSARLVTRYINFLNVIIPGVIGTIQIDWGPQRAILGMPYPYGDSLPEVFSGYYQSYPVNNDSSAAVILLSKWNAITHLRDTLAYNKLVFHGTVNSWTHFETPVIYRDRTAQPDSLTVLMLSCGGFNARNMFGSAGQVGSMALFDDISISGVNGFPLLLTPSVSVKLAPNPASSVLKIELGNEISNGYFEVYNNQAQLTGRYPMNGRYGQISVKELAAGSYYYKLTQNNRALNSGTFIVTK